METVLGYGCFVAQPGNDVGHVSEVTLRPALLVLR